MKANIIKPFGGSLGSQIQVDTYCLCVICGRAMFAVNFQDEPDIDDGWAIFDFETGLLAPHVYGERYRIKAIRSAERFVRAYLADGEAPSSNLIEQPAESVAVVEKFMKSGRSYRRLPIAKLCQKK